MLMAVMIALIAFVVTPPKFVVPPPGAVVISGAGSGIGRHVLERLSKELPEHTIYGIVRRGDQVNELMDVGTNVKPLVADLTSRSSIDDAMSKVKLAGRPLVGFFDAAGLPVPNIPVEYLNVDSMRQIYEVDVFGLVHLIQGALPLMKRAPVGSDLAETGSRIILMGSISGAVTPSFMASDPARAIETVADALRREVKNSGIAVSVIQAAFVDSPIIDKTKFLDHDFLEGLGAKARSFYPKIDKMDYESQVPREKMAPMTVVSDAVLDALRNPRPQIRYLCGTSPILPTKLLVPLLHFLPHHVLDLFE